MARHYETHDGRSFRKLPRALKHATKIADSGTRPEVYVYERTRPGVYCHVSTVRAQAVS